MTIELFEKILEGFASGTLSRRAAAARLAALVTAAAGAGRVAASRTGPAGTTETGVPEGSSVFEATGLNHLALAVTDVARSRDFYRELMGMEVIRDNSPGSCFLACGDQFVALFRSRSAGMDHYCYTVDAFDAGRAVDALRGAGLSPRRQENRVYVDDPDGLEIQLAGPWSAWPGPPPRR